MTPSVPALRGYRPGDWFAVLGERAAVLLPPGEKARVGALWALVDDGAGFDVVLDALIAGGLRELPGFVLVATEDGTTRVVARGPVRATASTRDGEVVVDGREATTWAERALTGVRSMRLDVGEDDDEPGGPAGDDLTIRGGLVRVRSVSQPPGQATEPTPVADPEPEPQPAPEPEPEPEPAPEPDPEPELATEAVPVVPEPWPGTPAPAPYAEEPGRPEQDADHDGDALTGRSTESAVDAAGPAVTSRPVARLVFSHGDDVSVDRPVVVGRSPEARRFTSGEQPRLVSVPSPQQEISSTHLEIRPGSGADHGSAVVTDLGSTNGSVLVQPGLPPEDLTPGVPVQLIPGAVLDLGDGVTIQVVDP